MHLQRAVLRQAVGHHQYHKPSLHQQQLHMTKNIQRQFYRRQLPTACVDFSSDDGIQYFERALGTGHARIYFKLAAQFRTQEEPAYCGLSTLVMVLNALEVDPGRIWKGPWRWYHENMLDCCTSLDKIKATGITFTQFLCIAACNRLTHESTFITQITQDEKDSFRDQMIKSVQSKDSVMVMSYDRQKLGQTGSGHFSPISAYDPETDRILVMDVARFKYPPHWVTVDDAMEAMNSLDNLTKKPRGYTILRIIPDSAPLISLKLNQDLVDAKPEILQSIHRWDSWLRQTSLTHRSDEEVLEAATVEVSKLAPICQIRNMPCCTEVTSADPCCCDSHSPDVQAVNSQMEAGCQAVLRDLSASKIRSSCSKSKEKNCTLAIGLIFSWPYIHLQYRRGSNGHRLGGIAQDQLPQLQCVTRQELAGIRTQFIQFLPSFNNININS